MLTVEELAIVPELEHVWMILVTVTGQHQWELISEWMTQRQHMKNVIWVILLVEVIPMKVFKTAVRRCFYRVAVPINFWIYRKKTTMESFFSIVAKLDCHRKGLRHRNTFTKQLFCRTPRENCFHKRVIIKMYDKLLWNICDALLDLVPFVQF